MEETGSGASDEGRVYASKEALKVQLTVQEEDYELPDGSFIRLQGLPVDEGMAAMQGEGDETSSAERMKRVCLLGIKEPELGPEDYEDLASMSVGLTVNIVDAIMRLSGLKLDNSGMMSASEEFLDRNPS